MNRWSCAKCKKEFQDRYELTELFGWGICACSPCINSWLDPNETGVWISVKDRLPEEGAIILVYADEKYCSGYEVIIAVYNGKYSYYNYSEVCGCWGGDSEDRIIGEVTHWMPLPPPPTTN